MYTVYKHTTPNQKIYIGITNQNPERRWRNGYKHNAHFTAAIEKYGWDNIKHEILFTGLTKEEAEQKEIELIAFYKSNKRSFGYNITAGGHYQGMLPEETKKKISKSHIGMQYDEVFRKKQSELKLGNKNRLGQKQSEECKKKISEKNKGKYAGDKNYFHSHIFSGKDNHNSKAVARYDLSGNLIDIKESANLYAIEMRLINASHISDVCKGRRKTAYGYVWKYVEKEVS